MEIRLVHILVWCICLSTTLGGMNNTNLCNPLPDSWGLPSMQPPFAEDHFHGAIDWTFGTAGLSASSVLNQRAARSTGIMSGIAAFGSMMEPEKFGNNERGVHKPVLSKLLPDETHPPLVNKGRIQCCDNGTNTTSNRQTC